MSPSLKALLFDLDGTLIDPRRGITRCIGHALRDLGRVPPSAEQLLWCIGPPLLRSLTTLVDGDERLAREALTRYRQHYDAAGKYENSVYEGIPETLSALRRCGFRLVVATSKPRRFASEIITHHHLDLWFDHVYGSEMDGRNSDKTDLIGHLLDEEKLQAGEVAMVGDRRFDMEGAVRCGVPAIGVTWGYGSRRELQDTGAGHLVHKPEDLLTLLRPGSGGTG